MVSRQSRQRLDSTQMFGRVARMSRLDCVRETLRLALKELEPATGPEARPVFWIALWERYVESQVDYRAGSETLARKLVEAGTDAWQLLEWLRAPEQAERAAGVQAQLLKRVFGEQFEVVAGQPAPLPKEKVAPERVEAIGDRKGYRQFCCAVLRRALGDGWRGPEAVDQGSTGIERARGRGGRAD